MRKLFIGIYIFVALFIVFAVVGLSTDLFGGDEVELEEGKQGKWFAKDNVLNQREEVEIETTVKNFVLEHKNVSVKDIEVYKDVRFGGGYVVTAYSSFNAKIRAKATQNRINRYSNDLGARLMNKEDVSEFLIFWKVPYLKDEGNIAKYHMQRPKTQIQLKEAYFDPAIFE